MAGAINVGVTVTDSDGDVAFSNVVDISGQIRFDDDGPTVSNVAGGVSVTLDESGGFDTVTSATPVITAALAYGADGTATSGATTYGVELTGGGTNVASGLATAVGDFAITLVETSATTIVGRYTDGGGVVRDAFTVTINSNGTLTVTQLVALEHLQDGAVALHNDALTLNGLISATVTIKDGDDDTATGKTEIGDQITFLDDGPTANADAKTVAEGATATGNVLTDNADSFGTDGPDATTPAGGVVGVRVAGGDTTTPVTTGTGTVINTALGTLTLAADGSYSYAANPNVVTGTATDSFVYTIRDADGDTSTTTLTITINDSGLAAGSDNVIVNEAGLPIGSTPAAATEIATGTIADNISGGTGPFTYTLVGSGTGAFGTFVLNPNGGYTYTLTSRIDGVTADNGTNTVDNAETFTVQVTDANGNSVTTTVTVDVIDDVPTARADPAIVVAEDAANVGGNLLDDDTQGADGATVTSVTIGATTTAIAAAGNTVITTANGVYTFNAAGVWSFDQNPVNSAAAVDASFSYTITDGDGDTATSTQAISLTDGANPGGGGSITLALDDQNLADGSTPANPDFASGSLVFTPGSDAIASIVFAGSVAGLGGGLTWVRVSDTQITGSDGARLVVTLNLVRSGNTANVTATLNDNYDDHPTINLDDLVNLGSVGVVATDIDGDMATGTVAVTVSDDLPTARPDTDAVTEDAATVATGDVITGVGTTNAPGSADTQGADGAAVTGVAVGTSAVAVAGNVGSALTGSYGSLTLAAGGGYTYTLTNGNATVQALGVGETLVETFSYTITDGDGDTSTTTLKITIVGSNDLPTIGSATTAVSDEGLPGGFPDSTGTVDTTNLTVRTGTITATDPDGDPLTFSLGAPATALSSGGQPIVWDTTNPQLLLGKVGADTIISIAINNAGNFTVTLSAPIDHPNTTLEDALSLVVPVNVNDGTTTVTNATALTIGLEDDSPVAIAPLNASLINAPGSSVYQSLDTDGDVDNNYGGDGPGSVIFTAATIAALQSQNLTSGGQALTYVISADGTVLTAEKPNGDDVFIIRLQPAGHADQYQVQMVQKLDSTSTVDFNSGGYNFVGGNTAWVGFVKAGDNNSQDILITPMKNGADGGTVNANNTETGVDNNNVGANEAVRVDFVVDLTGSPANGQDYGTLANQNHAFDSHYNANGASALFTNITGSSSVRLVARDDIDTDNDIGDGVKDTITKVAISFNNATLSVTANGTYNVGGQNFTVSFLNGEATVTGVVENTVIAGFTADGYNSIEFHHAGGDTFKIGDFGAVVQTENPVNFNVPVTIVDGDGDTAQSSLAITTASPLLVIGSATGDVAGEPTDHVVANPQGQVDGAIQGSNFDDTLVGDPGSVTITEGQQANVVLVLDSSGSMTTQIAFGNGTISRMQALKNGVNALIDSLSQSGALDVRITVIDFDADGDNLGTFNLIVNGVVQAGQVSAAKSAVNGMVASGGTNYEDGLQDALSWINGGNGIVGADLNKVVFVSDGLPTLWNNGGNGSDSDSSNVQNAMDQVLGIDDSSNEPQQILATGYSIDSVGVNVNSTLLARLSDVEDGNGSGGTGSATNAASAEQLAAVLQVLGGSTDLAAAGNDTITGGDGADVIFGDVLYTDTLATQLGVNLAPGSGWAVFQTLEGRPTSETLDPAGNGADWNRQDTIAYIRANSQALAQESGRTSGNDIINGGAGNDFIYGQEGNDTISGGDGDDLISGGSGRDVMTGGTGTDSFLFDAGQSRPTLGGSGNNGTITGHDVITDFNLAVDILNLPGTPVADGNGNVDGTNSALTVNGEPIRSHSVNNGVITFDDNNSFGTALALSSDARVAAAVDYLQRNDLGPAGTTVAFVAGTRTFVYQQVGVSPNPNNDILVELQGVAITNLNTLIGTRITPVTLDLDGDGLDFVGSAAGAAFDYDGDGVREATSWAGAGDGVLARDANGDGIVNNGSEIIFSIAGSSDLEGLRLQYDSNGDGQLSAADAAFDSFGVWQDANGNGVTDAGEFRSLGDLGIASIALTADGKAYVAGDGEVIVHGEASYTRTDGSSAAVGDVSFITGRPANDIERAQGNQALTSSLVAASLVAMVHDGQQNDHVVAKFATEDTPVAAYSEASVPAAVGDAPVNPEASMGAGDAAEPKDMGAAAHSTAPHADDASPAAIEHADDGDESATGERSDDGASDALFDMIVERGAPDGGSMEGLLALGEVPTAAVGGDAAAKDPAAQAVLAEVLEGGNAIDHIIDAVTGGEAVQVAGKDAPAFDLAQFLDQQVASSGGGHMPTPTLEQDLHNMAAA